MCVNFAVKRVPTSTQCDCTSKSPALLINLQPNCLTTAQVTCKLVQEDSSAARKKQKGLEMLQTKRVAVGQHSGRWRCSRTTAETKTVSGSGDYMSSRAIPRTAACVCWGQGRDGYGPQRRSLALLLPHLQRTQWKTNKTWHLPCEYWQLIKALRVRHHRKERRPSWSWCDDQFILFFFEGIH